MSKRAHGEIAKRNAIIQNGLRESKRPKGASWPKTPTTIVGRSSGSMPAIIFMPVVITLKKKKSQYCLLLKISVIS